MVRRGVWCVGLFSVGVAHASPEVRLTSWGHEDALQGLAQGVPTTALCPTLVHGALTAWTCDVPGGVEHSWRVETRPMGAGPLLLRLAVYGAEARQHGPGAMLTDGDHAWRYEGLLAWDATQRVLPSMLVVTEGGIDLRIDDAGAIWPVTVDPVLTDVEFDRVGGTEAYEYMGSYVSPAGDLNDDGYADMVGTSQQGANNNGVTALWYGGPAGFGVQADWTRDGGTFRHAIGAAAAAGDLNDDGVDDLVLGHGLSSASSWSEQVLVYYGSASGIGVDPDDTLVVASGVGHGHAVAVADLNDDGIDDVITGEPFRSGGSVRVWFGSALGVGGAPDLTFGATGAGDEFGASVAAGDLDGDGHPELLVGAPLTSAAGIDKGAVYIFPGTGSGPSATPQLFTQYQEGSEFGAAVVSGMDIDGDGLEDVVVGAPRWDTTDPAAGRAFVYYGHAGGSYVTEGAFVDGGAVQCEMGAKVKALGDLAADGYADVAIQGSTSGSCDRYVYEGGPAGLSATPVLSLARIETQVLTGVGDIDGDGLDDLAQSAASAGYDAGGGAVTGAGAIILWRGTRFDNDFDGFQNHYGDGTDCDDTDPDTYPGAPDVPGDGIDTNCDGLELCWFDGDRDGYYGPTLAETAETACDEDYFTTTPGDELDCDDGTWLLSPGATEVCDSLGVDEDCDGLVNDADPSMDLASAWSWYADVDVDGAGDPSVMRRACVSPPGFVGDDADCDDLRPDIGPAEREVCDALDVDEDCNGLADDLDAGVDARTQQIVFADRDMDTFGDPLTEDGRCDPSVDEVFIGGDCDDDAVGTNPDGVEVCDDVLADEDCDGLVNEADPDITDLILWHADIDRDGYGDPDVYGEACRLPNGRVEDDGDCDDEDPAAYPGAEEIAGDGIDQDCDGEDVPAEVDTDQGAPVQDKGCGCTHGSLGGGLPMLLGVLLIRRRRR